MLKEALKKGSITLSKKEKAWLAKEEAEVRAVGLEPEGRVKKVKVVEEGLDKVKDRREKREGREVKVPREGVYKGTL